MALDTSLFGAYFGVAASGSSPSFPQHLQMHDHDVVGTLPPQTETTPCLNPPTKSARRQVRAGRRRPQKSSLTPLRIATINTRSLLCERSIGLAETARSQVFREELVRKEYHIVCVQETKLDAKYSRDCQNFQVAANSSVDRVGGLQVLIAKGKDLQVLWTCSFSFRVLVVGVQWGQEKWCIVNAYAPTSAASDREYFDFLDNLVKAWRLARSNGMAIYTGADLNVRIGGEQDDLHVGPATLGEAPTATKARAEAIVAAMATVRLAAWSTMLGTPHYTWVSPHDTPAQIDYLIGDLNKLDRVQEINVIPLESFATDHSVVVGTLLPVSTKAKKQSSIRPTIAKIRGPDHSLAVKLALGTGDHSSWTEMDDPMEAMTACFTTVRQAVKDAPGSTAVLKHDWITGPTWDKIRQGAAKRRTMNRLWRSYIRKRQRWAWDQLRQGAAGVTLQHRQGLYGAQADGDLENNLTFEINGKMRCDLARLAWELARVACRLNAKQVQKMVKRDKNAWLSSKTDELAERCQEGVTSEIHRQVKRCLLKMTTNTLATRRAPLKDCDGKLHVTDDEKHILWQQHWTQLYGGSVKNSVDTFTSSSLPARLMGEALPIADSDLFTEAEIKSALRHQMNGKASIDGLPTREMTTILSKMVPTWTRAYNRFISLGDIPSSYRGTMLFVVPKKTATSATTDFRGIQLMQWSSKVFARALYLKCMAQIRVAIGQYGLGASSACDYPHLQVTQLQALARTRNRRFACWYIDVKTAFDKIIRQLLVAPGSSLTLETLKAMGIPDQRAREILLEVMDDQPILWSQGISKPIQRILAAYLTDTWIAIPEDQGGAQLKTGLGTPQGSSLSGLLFILYQQRIHTLLAQYIHEREYGLVLHAPSDNSYNMDQTELVHVPVIAYHDDSLVVLTSTTAQQLVEVVKEVAQYAITCYEGRNLLLNWSSMKSELMFLLPHTESIAFHATVAAESRRREWSHPCIAFSNVRLRVVRSYNYLGLHVQDSGSTLMHSKSRTAMAAGSLRQFGQVYASRTVSLRHKANLCNQMYTISTMMHGFAALKELEAHSEKNYATMYLHTWKACLGKDIVVDGQFIHHTEDYILDKVGKPSWKVWADVARLRLLIRVVQCTCPVVRALLASTGVELHSWWLAIAKSINRLRVKVPILEAYPIFDDNSRPIWMQIVALDKQKWRKHLKEYMEVDIRERRSRLMTAEPPPEPQPVPEVLYEMYACDSCPRQCSTYRGLLSHRRQAHGQESALAMRVGSNVCFACKGECTSRVAHLAHLAVNLRCSLATMIYCPRLSEAEIKAAKLAKNIIRTAPPRRGPKVIDNQADFPQSEPVRLLDINIG
eukprot:6473756-Amphidinium_carterae.1